MGLIETYDSLSEFTEKVRRQLAQTMVRSFKEVGRGPGESTALPTSQPQAPALSKEATAMLLAAASDQSGTILYIRTLGGALVQAGRKNLMDEGQGARVEAKWKAAIDELFGNGLIEPRGVKGEVFAVTNAGYEVAELLKGSSDS